MGVYETLFNFAKATGCYMGAEGTHPWAQGYPLTSQLPNGPEPPACIRFGSDDLKYPRPSGEPRLCKRIAEYYNTFYEAAVSPENVAVFAGGRPAILATLAFLQPDITVAVEETEYTPYYDMLRVLRRKVHLISSNPENEFRPDRTYYEFPSMTDRVFLLKSNPCNPTGVTTTGVALRQIISALSEPGRGALFDEAYEFFNEEGPESALRYILDIDSTDLLVVGTATKNLQVPGLRIGWIVAARRHIEVFRNYSSFGMGGVSRASQLVVAQLLERERVGRAREAVQQFYDGQRRLYGNGLASLGIELKTGKGGFYHWGRLPDGLSADEFNERLFREKAAILPGVLCDMARRCEPGGPLNDYVRFSFGAISPGSYDRDMAILERCLRA
jgi:aspartate/methionine/tyrosine aminotransferase